MNSIVKQQNSGSLAVVNLREDSRKGAEEIRQEDVSTPLLKILHQGLKKFRSRYLITVALQEPHPACLL